MKIVAKQGKKRFLVDCEDGYSGRVLDLDAKVLSAPAGLVSLGAHGPWKQVEADTDLEELLLGVEQHELPQRWQ